MNNIIYGNSVPTPAMTSFDAEKITAESYSVESYVFKDAFQKDYTFEDLLENENATFNCQHGSYAFDDDVKFKSKRAIKLIPSDSLQTTFRMIYPAGNFFNIIGLQELIAFVYVANITELSLFEVRFTLDNGSAQQNYTLSVDESKLKNGWNAIRLPMVYSFAQHALYGTVSMFRIITNVTSADTVVYLGGLISVKPNKAKIIFVDDHAYSNFYSLMYPRLKALGIPTTWATQPGRFGKFIDENKGTLLTTTEVEELAQDPYSEFSFHTYIGTQTENMTELETQADCQKSITALRKLGILPQNFWRAAWLHNLAPHAASCQEYMQAFAYSDAVVKNGAVEQFPFLNKYDISRYSVHNRQDADLEKIFLSLKNTHGTMIMYTHSCCEGSNTDLSLAGIEKVIALITQGVNEGWLEGTTFNRLCLKYDLNIEEKKYNNLLN